VSSDAVTIIGEVDATSVELEGVASHSGPYRTEQDVMQRGAVNRVLRAGKARGETERLLMKYLPTTATVNATGGLHRSFLERCCKSNPV
jgi:hypothetical protein